MKIQQVIQTEQVKEIDIELPYFCFNDKKGYYKVVSEETVIAVNLGSYCSITKSSLWLQKSDISKCSQITEGEFNQAYHEALMEIGKYVRQLKNQP